MENPASDSIADLFLLPLFDEFLLCSPLRGMSAIINAPAVNRLCCALAGKGRHIVDDPVVADLIARALAPAAPPLVDSDALNPPFLGIVPTRSCNGACHYCNFGASNAAAEVIDFRLIREAVDWFGDLMRRSGRKTLEVHLFGGEPFVALDAVVFTVHAVRAAAGRLGLKPHLEVSTNGVMTETWAQWTGNYFDAVVVSLDGPAEIHDAHRPLKDGAGSFFRACSTAKIISRSRAALCLRCCSSNRNVNDLAGIARLFCEEFDPQTIDFETVVPNETARSAGISAPDPFAFAENFIRAERVAQSMGIDAIYSAINTNGPRTSICPVGKDAVILFADGQISSCYLPEEYCLSKGRSLRVGRCRGGQVDIDMDHMRRLRAIGRSKPRCGRCFCRWTCCGGCHISVTPPGCSVEYDDFCLQTRIITAHRLIENLGAHDRAARFFGDRRSQERLTRNPSDRLDDWRGL